jgi:hypothetical protein
VYGSIFYGLALGCFSKYFKIPFAPSYVINSILSKFSLNFYLKTDFWITCTFIYVHYIIGSTSFLLHRNSLDKLVEGSNVDFFLPNLTSEVPSCASGEDEELEYFKEQCK